MDWKNEMEARLFKYMSELRTAPDEDFDEHFTKFCKALQSMFAYRSSQCIDIGMVESVQNAADELRCITNYIERHTEDIDWKYNLDKLKEERNGDENTN